jgi:hypothetical protein
MINKNYKIIKLLTITIALLSLVGSLGSYLTQLGNERVFGPLIYTLIICFISIIFKFKNLKIPVIILILSWILYFNLIVPLLFTVIIVTAVFKIGDSILNLFGLREKSIFIAFCLGHTSLAFLLWLVIRFTEYNAIYFYKIIGLFIFIISLVSFKILIKNKFIILKRFYSNIYNNQNLVFSQSVFILSMSLLVYATLYSFYFDDINGYMYAPLRVFYDNGFIFGPERPGFMTNMSALSLGYGSLLSSFLGYDRNLFIMTFKFFHASSYLIGIITFVGSLKFCINNYLRGFAIILLGLLPLTIFEITGNYADYYVLLVSFYVFYTLACIIFLKIKLEFKYFYINSILIGLFLIVSLKTIPYVFSGFIILFFYLSMCNYGEKRIILSYVLNNKKIIFINLTLISLPLLLLFIDNIIKSGNPTFPGGNGLWKSPYFSLGGLVAGRFHFPNMPDGTTFLQVFSFTPQAAQLFSSGNSYFPIYGVFSQTIFYLIPFLVILILFKYGNNEKYHQTLSILLLSILLIIVTFVTISLVVGPQHRYFFGLNTYLFIPAMIGLSKFYIQSYKYIFFSISKWIFFVIALFSFFGNGIEAPPFKITNDRLLVSGINGDKWLSKKLFYEKVNNYISDDKSIMLSYLQDKFFIDSKNVYELDWYDFPIQSQLNSIWDSKEHPTLESKLYKINKHLCDNNFRYFILSKNAIIYHPLFNESYLRRTDIYDNYQSLNILLCPN